MQWKRDEWAFKIQVFRRLFTSREDSGNALDSAAEDGQAAPWQQV